MYKVIRQTFGGKQTLIYYATVIFPLAPMFPVLENNRNELLYDSLVIWHNSGQRDLKRNEKGLSRKYFIS